MKKQANEIGLEGRFHLVHTRNGIILHDLDIPNGIVNQGRASMLSKMWSAPSGQAVNPTWDFGFMSTSSPSLLATDTATSHAGWAIAAYSSPSTTTFTGGVNGFKQAINLSVSSFSPVTLGTPVTITTGGSIGGLFLASTPSGGGGAFAAGDVLWSTATLGASPVTVAIGDVVYVSYTVSVTAAIASVVNEGKDRLLDAMFNNHVFTWQANLMSGAAAIASDTFASHPGWTDAGISTALTMIFETPIVNSNSIFTDINHTQAPFGTVPGMAFPVTASGSINGIYIFDSTNTWLFGNSRTAAISLVKTADPDDPITDVIFYDYRVGLN